MAVEDARGMYEFLVSTNQLNPELAAHQQLIARFGSPEQPMPSAEGGKDPNVQHFLDLIAQGSQPAGPDSEFASGRFMEDPPLLEGDADPIEERMLSGRDQYPSLDFPIGESMPSPDEKEIMSPTGDAKDFPTPAEMQDAADPSSFWTFGARDTANLPPKPETAQLLEDKSEVKEEAAEVGVVETEDPGFAARSGMAMPASFPQPSFPQKYKDATSGPLTPAAKKALKDGMKYVEAYYKFMDENFKIELDLEALTKNVDEDIKSYNTKIEEIAQEEISPPFDGDTTRTVLAVIGAALGAAAATFGGTPNYAMQIIDKAIDREQQRKLKTKEMKLLSAREQRRILQEQRGQMIQYALSKTNQAIAAASAKGQAAQAVASLKMLQAQFTQAAQQNLDQLGLDIIKTQINAIMMGLQFQAKTLRSQNPRMVEALAITGNDGQTIQFTPFMAKSEKAAEEIWRYKAIIANADSYLNKLEPLLKRSALEKLTPAAFSQTRKEILYWTAELEKEFKNQAGFGANYAEREIRLNEQTLPSVMDNTVMNTLFGAEKAIAPMREKLRVTYLNKVAEHGGGIFQGGTTQPLEVPNVTKVADAPNG